MPSELRMPKLGMTMTEAVLGEWLVEDGAQIDRGTPIYTIETDKSTTEIEAQETGTLRRAGMAGETYAVGMLLGTIE